jgi:hypothetical protein
VSELIVALVTAVLVTLAVAPAYARWEAAGRPVLEEL